MGRKQLSCLWHCFVFLRWGRRCTCARHWSFFCSGVTWLANVTVHAVTSERVRCFRDRILLLRRSVGSPVTFRVHAVSCNPVCRGLFCAHYSAKCQMAWLSAVVLAEKGICTTHLIVSNGRAWAFGSLLACRVYRECCFISATTVHVLLQHQQLAMNFHRNHAGFIHI